MILELLGTISGILAVTGVILNNHKLIGCFKLWLLSNTLSLYCHISADMYSLAGRDGIFLILAVHGWMKWSKK